MSEERRVKSEERRAKSEHVGARGDGIIQVEDGDGALGTAEYRILFTNRAIAEAESSTGKGIIGLLQGFQTGGTGIGDVAHLLAAGLEAARRDAHAGGKPFTLAEAYQIMDQVGFAEVTRVTVEAISAVMSYKGAGANGNGAGGEASDSPND
jgi:hypothetical protein